MNERTHNETKVIIIKSLAIIGVIATILLAVWLSIQAVRVLPGAFASLASIASSLSNYQTIDELSVATEKSIVNSGESFTISWTDVRREGEYALTYECTEGINVAIRSVDGEIVSMDCTNVLSLPAHVHALDIMIVSERRRFSDVPFTIRFTGTDEEELFSQEHNMTVVNATIPQYVDDITSLPEEDIDDDTEEEVVTNEPTVPAQPAPVETYTYTPVSIEDGFTDLRITFLGIGTLDEDVFTPTAVLDNNDTGSVRFEVRNIGTKTSDEWSFTATLPGGAQFSSKVQEPLKPNERVHFTLGFELGGFVGDTSFVGTIITDRDTNTNNNTLSWYVKVSD